MKVYFEDIYEHIGYLFYALSCQRGKLNAVTFDKLKRLVDQQWYPIGSGITVESNLVNHLQSGMHNAFLTAMTSQQAFDRFTAYYEVHSLPFGKPLRLKIFATANTIASEFSGDGVKSELITRLERLFEVNPIALI